MNAAIMLLQREIAELREYIADCPCRIDAENAQHSIMQLGDALDTLRRSRG